MCIALVNAQLICLVFMYRINCSTTKIPLAPNHVLETSYSRSKVNSRGVPEGETAQQLHSSEVETALQLHSSEVEIALQLHFHLWT